MKTTSTKSASAPKSVALSPSHSSEHASRSHPTPSEDVDAIACDKTPTNNDVPALPCKVSPAVPGEETAPGAAATMPVYHNPEVFTPILWRRLGVDVRPGSAWAITKSKGGGPSTLTYRTEDLTGRDAYRDCGRLCRELGRLLYGREVEPPSHVPTSEREAYASLWRIVDSRRTDRMIGSTSRFARMCLDQLGEADGLTGKKLKDAVEEATQPPPCQVNGRPSAKDAEAAAGRAEEIFNRRIWPLFRGVDREPDEAREVPQPRQQRETSSPPVARAPKLQKTELPSLDSLVEAAREDLSRASPQIGDWLCSIGGKVQDAARSARGQRDETEGDAASVDIGEVIDSVVGAAVDKMPDPLLQPLLAQGIAAPLARTAVRSVVSGWLRNVAGVGPRSEAVATPAPPAGQVSQPAATAPDLNAMLRSASEAATRLLSELKQGQQEIPQTSRGEADPPPAAQADPALAALLGNALEELVGETRKV